MSGRLGAVDLQAHLVTTVARCDHEDGAVVSVNFCNRNNEAAEITLAVTSDVHAFTDDSRYVEYRTVLVPGATLERTEIKLSHNDCITVKSTVDLVNCVAWGITVGDVDPDPFAPANLTAVAAGGTTTVRLGLTNTADGAVVYALESGSLPADMTLDANTGELSGTLDTSGYTAAGVNTTFSIRATIGGSTLKLKTFTVKKVWADGLTELKAAPSARFIKEVNASATDGMYWIRAAETDVAQQVWCDMTEDGGGWTLMHIATGGPRNTMTRSFYDMLNGDPVDVQPFRDMGRFNFGKSHAQDTMKTFTGVQLMKQYNVYDSSDTLIDYTSEDTNTNGITHQMSNTATQTYDLLDLGAGVSYDEIYSNTWGNGNFPLTNPVTLYVDGTTEDGSGPAGYNYGTSDTLYCTGASRGFSNNGNASDQVGGQNMQGWGARHWIAYNADTSGQSIVRCQYRCWDGSENVTLEVAVLLKEDTTHTVNTVV